MEKIGYYLEESDFANISDKQTRELYTEDKTGRERYSMRHSYFNRFEEIVFGHECPEERLLRHLFRSSEREELTEEQQSRIVDLLNEFEIMNEAQYHFYVDINRHGSIYLKKEDRYVEDRAFFYQSIMWKIVEGHLGMVKEVAQEAHEKYNLEIDDLFQQGCVGLIQAVHYFTPYSKKVSFKNYAAACIWGEIERLIKSENENRLFIQGQVVVDEQNELIEQAKYDDYLDVLDSVVIESLIPVDSKTSLSVDELMVVEKYYDLGNGWARTNRTQKQIAEEVGLSNHQVARILAAAQEKLMARLFEAGFSI